MEAPTTKNPAFNVLDFLCAEGVIKRNAKRFLKRKVISFYSPWDALATPARIANALRAHPKEGKNYLPFFFFGFFFVSFFLESLCFAIKITITNNYFFRFLFRRSFMRRSIAAQYASASFTLPRFARTQEAKLGNFPIGILFFTYQ